MCTCTKDYLQPTRHRIRRLYYSSKCIARYSSCTAQCTQHGNVETERSCPLRSPSKLCHQHTSKGISLLTHNPACFIYTRGKDIHLIANHLCYIDYDLLTTFSDRERYSHKLFNCSTWNLNNDEMNTIGNTGIYFQCCTKCASQCIRDGVSLRYSGC